MSEITANAYRRMRPYGQLRNRSYVKPSPTLSLPDPCPGDDSCECYFDPDQLELF